MNFNFWFSKRANNKNTPPLSTSLYNDKFEKNRSKSLNQIDIILSAQADLGATIIDKNRLLTVRQHEIILSIPAISDFYNFFFVEENEVTQEDDLKKFISYFWKLVLNDFEKMFIFCIVLIDYYEHKVTDLLIKIDNPREYDYSKMLWKVNFLNIYRDNLHILRNNLDLFYNFDNANSSEHKHFAELIFNWKIKTAYDYANDLINNEYKLYKEIYKVIYWKDIDINQKTLIKYQIWTKQKRKIEKKFPPILYM